MKHFFAILAILFPASFAFAHPLDVSNTTMTLYEYEILGVTYVHPVELDRILIAETGMRPSDIGVDSYYSLSGTLTRYLAETIEIENQGQTCQIGNFELREDMMIDEIYTQGFPISYTFRCDIPIRSPEITINFMIEVPLQTNRLYIYRPNSDGGVSRTDYRVLNARKTTHSVSYEVLDTPPLDSDKDGIVDEDEHIYRTNPESPDTDGDGYSDAQEIEKSWDPLSTYLSPGQAPYELSSTESTMTPSISVSPSGNTLSQNSGMWGQSLFDRVLREIRLYVDREVEARSFFWILFIIGVLGFFHALGPGHSKSILISNILDEGMSYPKVILYSAVFTLIHILDIVVVVLISKFLFTYIDSSTYLSFIAQISAILVFGIGMYLLYQALVRYHSKKYYSSLVDSKGEKKSHIFMAVITGLTPCAFGWSIFLMLFALGKSSLALPMLAALGCGIFLCLIMIGTIVWYTKTKIYKKAPKIALFSPIISALFITIIGFGLTFQNF